MRYIHGLVLCLLASAFAIGIISWSTSRFGPGGQRTEWRPGAASSRTGRRRTDLGGETFVETFLNSGALKNPLALNRTKLAVIIETRPLPELVPVILNFLANVPPDWPFRIYHSLENWALLNRSASLRRYSAEGRIRTYLHPAWVPYASYDDVSEWLTTKTFWEHLSPAEHILFFQSDSILCGNAHSSIEDFVDYDWVGASWDPRYQPKLADVRGGNGGLSLRKRSKLLRVLELYPFSASEGFGEDVFFSRKLALLPDANLPSRSVSDAFSLESTDNGHTPFGIHKPISYFDISNVYERCPEARILFQTSWTAAWSLLSKATSGFA